MAALIEAQDAPLSTAQVRYLEREFYGGMGSLNDLGFDNRQSADMADKVGRKFEKARAQLFESFHVRDGTFS